MTVTREKNSTKRVRGCTGSSRRGGGGVLGGATRKLAHEEGARDGVLKRTVIVREGVKKKREASPYINERFIPSGTGSKAKGNGREERGGGQGPPSSM